VLLIVVLHNHIAAIRRQGPHIHACSPISHPS
jgi:hypothetical protein